MFQSQAPGLFCLPSIRYRFEGDTEWMTAQPGSSTEESLVFLHQDIRVQLDFERQSETVQQYHLTFHANRPAQVRLTLEAGSGDWWHLIPANIHGDNNLRSARRGEYMLLTQENPEDVFCSPFWELRADRVPQPVIMIIGEDGTLAISVNPYTDLPDGSFVRNGIRAELPNRISVSAGYTNDPVTYTNRQTPTPSTAHYACQGHLDGRIYAVPGSRDTAPAQIIRAEYELTRECPAYHKTTREAAQALLDTFLDVSWNDEWHNYTNCCCHLWNEPELKSWRQLPEIGWTAGGIMAYPFLLAEDLLNVPEERFAGKMTGSDIADEIAGVWNPVSGMINDVTRPDWKPDWEPNPVNGWWTYLGLTADCHCAYTNGSAVYYLLKMLLHLQKKGEDRPAWRKAALNTLDTVISLQRDDGCLGYTYSRYEKKVLDWEGFAGCWFAAAMPLAYTLTGDEKYLAACRKAIAYYGTSVRALCCCGSPMDTWKSVDQEGNLAYIRAVRLMHEITGEACFLKDLIDGANYQFLWQYGYKARPECPPLKGNWNSCGGSITSVSNPHVHPMGVLVIDDLYYLGEQTGDSYYTNRADDQYAWIMQCLELYPDISGYGRYGLLTERYCPSDGLTTEQYSDGTHASMWFSYNGWAGANVLEAMLEKLRREQRSCPATRKDL